MGFITFLKEHRFCLLFFILISIIYTLPLFIKPTTIGIIDWDLWLFYNEVARKSILEFNQIPFWNPYYCGGNILLAHPESQIFSPFFLFVLLFGSVIGIKIAIFFGFFLGLLGMYFLARFFKLSEFSSATAAFIYMISAPFGLRIAIGQFSYLALGFYPLAFLFFLKGLHKRRYLIGSSLCLAFAFFTGVVYELSFFILFLGIYAVIYSIFKRKVKAIVVFGLIILLMILIISFKLIPLIDFIYNNPRTAGFSSNEYTSLEDFADNFLKSTRLSYHYYGVSPPHSIPRWWEGVVGIGVFGVALVILGIVYWIRNEKPLVITSIIFVLIYLGDTFPINLWKLLHAFPPFNSFYVIGRVSFILIFSSALLGGAGFSWLETKFNKRLFGYYLIFFLFLIFGFYLFSMNGPIISDALQIEIPNIERSDVFFQTIKDFSYNKFMSRGHYLAVQENKGDLRCTEEVRTATSVSAIPRESQLYKGEAYLIDGGKANIIYFSPNKITVKVESDKENLLVLNQNYEKDWNVNPGNVENYLGLLSVRVPKGESNLTFTYLPVSFVVGVVISLISILLIYLFIYNYNKKMIFVLMIILLLIALYFVYESKQDIKIPEIYKRLNKDTESYAIIEIPFTSPLFHAFRYYNEQHNKDVIWHHPSQGITYKVHLLKKIFLADDYIDYKTLSDIIVQDSRKIGLSVLNYYNIRKVILHKDWYGSNVDWMSFTNMFINYNWTKYKDWYGNEDYNKTRKLLDDFLIKSYEDEDVILYDVPLDESPVPFMLMGSGWHGLEEDNRGKFSWIKNNKGSIEIISPDELDTNISFTVDLFHKGWNLDIILNDKLLDGYFIEKRIGIKQNLNLRKGINKLEFKVRDKCIRPIDFGENKDPRCLSLAIENIRLED
ncbi:MAG: hypothetical protein AABW56_01910 [Nanoarchaeota archaeon]